MISIDQFYNIIEMQDEFSFIIFKSSNENNYHSNLELIQYDNRFEYIAISHIREKDLENSVMNKLPIC